MIAVIAKETTTNLLFSRETGVDSVNHVYRVNDTFCVDFLEFGDSTLVITCQFWRTILLHVS